MARDQNTFEKRRREMEKKRKAEEKRERRRRKKEESNAPTEVATDANSEADGTADDPAVTVAPLEQ